MFIVHLLNNRGYEIESILLTDVQNYIKEELELKEIKHIAKEYSESPFRYVDFLTHMVKFTLILVIIAIYFVLKALLF